MMMPEDTRFSNWYVCDMYLIGYYHDLVFSNGLLSLLLFNRILDRLYTPLFNT